jgi:hypothetical protein
VVIWRSDLVILGIWGSGDLMIDLKIYLVILNGKIIRSITRSTDPQITRSDHHVTSSPDQQITGASSL